MVIAEHLFTGCVYFNDFFVLVNYENAFEGNIEYSFKKGKVFQGVFHYGSLMLGRLNLNINHQHVFSNDIYHIEFKLDKTGGLKNSRINYKF